MAYEQIANYIIHDYEQEEIIEYRDIAGEDGVVSKHEIVVQSYAHIWSELKVFQDLDKANNTSDFKAEIWLHAQAGEKGNGFKIYQRSRDGHLLYFDDFFYNSDQPSVATITVAAGKTISKKVRRFESTGELNTTHGAQDYLHFVHNLDGSLSGGYGNKSSGSIREIKFNGFVYYNYVISDEREVDERIDLDFDYGATPLKNDRSVIPISADNFTDVGDPSFTYKATTGYNLIYWQKYKEYYQKKDEIIALHVALSLDGVTIDIPYREIPIDGTSYTFNLTEEEREILRNKTTTSANVPIFYMLKVIRSVENTADDVTTSNTFIGSTQRVLTVIGCQPILNPTLRDVNSDTVALTGNENIFVQYESMVEFSTGAVASKHATIVSQSVQNGSKIVENLYNGVIDDIESADFIFNATDSRGLHADTVVVSNSAMIPYIKPTCAQKVVIELTGETGAVVTVAASGKYYNGSFGIQDNSLVVETRYKVDNGDYGEWIALTDTANYSETEYSLTGVFTGFNYESSYTFQTRATDKLNTVITSEYVAKLIPVFDWSETDFNFNVPVNISADELNMHNETIIRHSADTNNTVLSANRGNIYLRPGGSTNTSGESVIYSDGSVKLGGNVEFADSFTIDGNNLNDFVIDSGETSMGSNGTWYWQKWASGKSEAWGCRNFGRMAITTAWGNLYRSEIFTQELPDDVFKTTPDVININLVNISNGAWIVKHENSAPSAVTTGAFIVVRPASATPTVSYIGFHIIGLWK